MSKRGKRRQQSIDRRKIVYALKTKILQESFNDFLIQETVSRTTHIDLEQFGIKTFGEQTYYRFEDLMNKPFFESIDDGVVLTDSKGKGAFQ